MKKLILRMVSLIVAMCIVFSICTVVHAIKTEETRGANELKGHWAEETLTEWVRLGLLMGDNKGNYNPNSKITRAEFMALVNRVMKYTAKSDKVREFSDISPNKWYYDDASKALGAGYINGTTATTLSPEETITREQAITIISRIKGIDQDGDTSILSVAMDSAVIASWAKGPIAGAIREGLVTGSNGRINPKADTTRSEATVLLDRVRTDTRTYYFAGTYGPESGTATAGNIVIASPGIKLWNLIVTGNLEIADIVGDGEATLDNVVIQGDLVARGGKPTIIAAATAVVADDDTSGNDSGSLGSGSGGSGSGGSGGSGGGGGGKEKDTSVLTGISISSQPSKLTYELGETLDLTGLVVKGSYSDNTTKTEKVTMSNIYGFDSSTAGEKTITVTVSDKIASFSVNVRSSEQGPDTVAPSVPIGLTGTAVSSAVVNLSWIASTDNVGVSSYRIYRGGNEVGTSTTTSYSDTGLTAGTSYSYAVSAYDAAGNESNKSSSVNIKTRTNNDPATYTLNVVAEHASLTFIPDKEAYSPDEQVKITAVPHDGYGFGHWYGDAYGTLEQITITMDDNKTLYAFTPEKKTITLPGGVTMDFVRIPSGSYTMGNINQNPWASQNYPQFAHRVNIAYEFYVQTTETTQEQLIAIMGENSIDANNYTDANVEWMRGNKKPAVNLPWGDTPGMWDDLDAHGFINELNEKGLGEFRLPSEAEWEYFARGPQTNPYRDAPYFFGEADGILPVDSSSFKLDEYAWWGRSANPSSGLPETARLLPNPYGLYDIYGNVYEWCEDDWKDDYNDVPDDGSPYINHTAEYPYLKVLRGGWRYYSDAFRFTSYYRASHEIYFCHGSTGIRLVMKVPVDNQPPSLPTNLSAQAVSSAQINLSWVESTDNDRVSGYKIYRNDECIGISHSAAFSDCGLESDTTYTYAIQAFDAFGNTSAKTSNVTAKTGILSNVAPQIQGQSVSVAENGEIEINLQAMDDENDPLTYHIVSWPQHGYLYGLYADGTVPVVRYRPVADYDGADSFTYRVHDSYSYSTTATVGISVTGVNKEPLAESFSASLNVGEQILINLKGKDPDNDYLFYEIVGAPAYGNVVQAGSHTVIYTPKEGYSGTDSFIYKASDGQLDSLPANVTIIVTPPEQENVLTLNFDGNINDISGQGCEMSAIKNESPYTGSLDFVSSSIDGMALSFSKEKGVYIRAEDSGHLSGMNSLYVSVYAKKSTVDRGGYILQKRNGYALCAYNNSVYFQVRTTAGNVQVNSYSAGISDTDWHHYEAYYNGYSACLYVDGVQKAKMHTCGAVETNEFPLYIGSRYTGIDKDAFDGEIDQLQIRTKPPAGNDTDTEAPKIPVNIRTASITNNQVSLVWDKPVDNTGVTGYRIYRDGVPIATSATASYSNTDLTPDTRYVYTVTAYDAAGNESVQSMALVITTKK
jgi:formylglycine-generating enzyme required for sulfatase activity/chitodextrinase